MSHYTCDICGEGDMDENNMKSHIQIVHVESSASCPFCDLADVQLEELINHIAVSHDEVKQDQISSEALHIRKTECQKLKNGLTPKPSLKDDNRKTGSVITCFLECPICRHTCDTELALQVHINQTHLDSENATKQSTLNASDRNTDFNEKSVTNETDDFICPFCGLNFANLMVVEKHVQVQHSEAEDCSYVNSLTGNNKVSVTAQLCKVRAEEAQRYWKTERETTKVGTRTRSKNKSQCCGTDKPSKQSQDAFAADVDDESSCTNAIIPKLSVCNELQNSQIYLCTAVNHYSTTYFDKGWGCGYRNAQMLLSSLSLWPDCRRLLFGDVLLMPSIRKLQMLIEDGWKQGYDTAGAAQLGNKLVNTRKWIGATEVMVLLKQFRIRCDLIDFHCPTGPSNTHPRLFEWVHQYFSVATEFKAPLYFQHQGHSRTIIGWEQCASGSVNILVLDPSMSKTEMNNLQSGSKLIKRIRCGRQSLKSKQYQIIAVHGIEPDGSHPQKHLTSIRIP